MHALLQLGAAFGEHFCQRRATKVHLWHKEATEVLQMSIKRYTRPSQPAKQLARGERAPAAAERRSTQLHASSSPAS